MRSGSPVGAGVLGLVDDEPDCWLLSAVNRQSKNVGPAVVAGCVEVIAPSSHLVEVQVRNQQSFTFGEGAGEHLPERVHDHTGDTAHHLLGVVVVVANAGDRSLACANGLAASTKQRPSIAM